MKGLMCFCTFRVLKEAMRTGGSNLTQEHTEDLSLCALFLMEASKKVDREFRESRSTAHTTKDATKDITRLNTIYSREKLYKNYQNAPH